MTKLKSGAVAHVRILWKTIEYQLDDLTGFWLLLKLRCRKQLIFFNDGKHGRREDTGIQNVIKSDFLRHAEYIEKEEKIYIRRKDNEEWPSRKCLSDGDAKTIRRQCREGKRQQKKSKIAARSKNPPMPVFGTRLSVSRWRLGRNSNHDLKKGGGISIRRSQTEGYGISWRRHWFDAWQEGHDNNEQDQNKHSESIPWQYKVPYRWQKLLDRNNINSSLCKLW